MTQYQDEFLIAAERTKRLGFAVPDIKLSEDRLINNYRLERVFNEVKKEFRGFKPIDFARKCIQIHNIVQPFIDKRFFGDSFYTVGYIHEPPNDIHKIEESEIKELMNNGLNTEDIKLHTWITLPTMELIDFTVNSTIDEYNKRDSINVSVLAKHPEDLTGGLKYHPVLVGKEFLVSLGIL